MGKITTEASVPSKPRIADKLIFPLKKQSKVDFFLKTEVVSVVKVL